MATSKNAQAWTAWSGSKADHDATVTLTAGTNRKLIVMVGVESATSVFDSVTFDQGGGDQAAMNAVAGGGTPSRINDVLGALYEYDIPDGVGTGSKTIRTTLGTANSGTGYTIIWVVNGGATGALEDVDSVANASQTNLAVVLTNASTSYVGAGIINGAASPTYSWTGGDLTEWFDDQAGSAGASAADATGTANADCDVVKSVSSNDSVLIGWAVAEAATSSAVASISQQH